MTRSQRLSMMSGILYALAQLGAFVFFAIAILPRFAPVDAAPLVRAAAVKELGETLRVANFLLMLPIPFFLFFVGGAFSLLRKLEGGSDVLAATALAAGSAMALMWPLGAVISDLELDLAQAGGDAITVSVLDAIAPYSLALSAFARVVFVTALSVPILKLGKRLSLTAWTGIVIGILSLVGTTTLVFAAAFPVLALSTLLFDVWLLVFCVVWLRSPLPGNRA
ncbi:MAG TPA: hypothetical protein VF456_09065 [Vicinamibacterales bacterium]